MSDLVDVERIEQIVGARRHATMHQGRADSVERRVYILHSHECRDSIPDLRGCPFSLALDLGIDVDHWVEDEPVALCIQRGRLVPIAPTP